MAQTLDDTNWRDFISQGKVCIVLTRTDCGNCETLISALDDHSIPIGRLTLDLPGSTEFKREYPQIALQASVLPFTILFDEAEWVDSIMGARPGKVMEWFD